MLTRNCLSAIMVYRNGVNCVLYPSLVLPYVQNYYYESSCKSRSRLSDKALDLEMKIGMQECNRVSLTSDLGKHSLIYCLISANTARWGILDLRMTQSQHIWLSAHQS
jgi:hypothetical protein